MLGMMARILLSLQLHLRAVEVALNRQELEIMAGVVEEVLILQQQPEPLIKVMLVVLKVEAITEMLARLVEAQEQ